MAHGVDLWTEGATSPKPKCDKRKPREGKAVGSRRIFSPQFKLQVLDSYRKDADCRGNQRATARKYGIHRRQIQKWLQMESTLRCNAEVGEAALNLVRQRDDVPPPPGLPQPMEQDKSDSEDEASSESSLYDQDRALDFTCAALSKRRFFSISFKLQVLDSFHNDPSCKGNQRATARKFGVHRRQVQKWLDHEEQLRAEPECSECLDLSTKREVEVPPSPAVTPPSQEKAICLVKPQPDLYRPYDLSPPPASHPPEPAPWPAPYHPYYGVMHSVHSTYIPWISPAPEIHYYKPPCFNLFPPPMYS